MKSCASIVALLLVVASVAWADMYKWIDENGKVHYTDTPPPGKKAKKLDLKINTFSAPPEVSTVANPPPRTAAAGGTARVRMFTTTWCGYCKQARAYLQARGIPFEDIDVESSASGAAEYRALGGRGVPVILVGEQRMDGYSEGKMAGMLKQAGL